MSTNDPYQGQHGPYGQGGQGGPPPGPYGYPQQPNIPPNQAGYAFGPFAPQPTPGSGPAGPPPPTMPEPAPQPGAPRRRGTGLIILGIVVLVLILIGVTAAVLVRSRSVADPQPRPTQTQLPTSGGPTATGPPTSTPSAGGLASDAVSGYLAALAAGDATAALSFAADPVQPGPFMTDKVLAESIKRTPITDIEVPTVEDQQVTTVPAAYRLGKTEVTTSYEVAKASGTWKLSVVSKTLDLGLVRSPSIPMLINGVPVNADFVDLLPGSYAFTPAFPTLTYGPKSVVLIKDPNDYANVLDLRLSLSDQGRKTVAGLANRSYDACLRTRVTRPKNCPFSWTNSAYRYRNGSVTWRQIGSDPFAKPTVQLNGRSARVRISLRVRISGPCTFSGNSGTCTGSVTGTGVASIRLDREKLSVVWLT